MVVLIAVLRPFGLDDDLASRLRVVPGVGLRPFVDVLLRVVRLQQSAQVLILALLAGVRASAYTQGIVNGELVYVWRKVKKKRTDARMAHVTHRWYGPAIVVGKEKNNVFVSYRGRVTQVAPECLRNASVAVQMGWGISTEEKALFEKALDEEDLSW